MQIYKSNPSRPWGKIALLAALLLLPALAQARTSPRQERLRGLWVSVDGTPPNLTFVPTGATTGQVGFGSGGVVDYHFYRFIGKNTVRIWDGRGVYVLRLRGGRLHMNKRGPRPARVYVKRPLSVVRPEKPYWKKNRR